MSKFHSPSPLLEVERPLVKVDELGVEPEGGEEVDGAAVADEGGVLHEGLGAVTGAGKGEQQLRTLFNDTLVCLFVYDGFM